MTVVLDTDDLAPHERGEAVAVAIHEASVSSYVVHEDPHGDIHARMDVWEFGNTSIFRAEMSGIHLIRTPKQARRTPAPVLAIAVQESGNGRHDQHGNQRLIPPRELLITDLNSPYDFGWSGSGASQCLYVPLDELALPHHVIQEAGAHPCSSPVYQLVASHIMAMTNDAPALSADSAARELGAASIELVRALLASAARDQRHARAAMAETLLTQVRTYIRRHLDDPNLGPDTIAAAHNISVRYLYRLCSNADFSLEQWIIGQRLEGARAELTDPHSRHRSVAVVGERWGFSSPAHFSRRFRATYGVSPRDWRRIANEQPTTK